MAKGQKKESRIFGFRTGKWWKKIIACVYYVIAVLLIVVALADMRAKDSIEMLGFGVVALAIPLAIGFVTKPKGTAVRSEKTSEQAMECSGDADTERTMHRSSLRAEKSNDKRKLWKREDKTEGQKIRETRNIATNPILWLVSLCLVIPIPFLVFVLIYSWFYFRGKEFCGIRSEIQEYIEDCNALNAHIEELRRSYVKAEKTDYGEAHFENISKYKYQKKGFNAEFAPNIYDCSRQICASAQKQPFKYICKYFNVAPNEETLTRFEEVLNNFYAAEEGKLLLKNKKDEILLRVKERIPALVRVFMAKSLEKNLGFKEIEFNTLYFPQFTFRYISSGGNAGTQFTTTMDIPMLERFVKFLDENVTKRKSAAGQRALMTSKLRMYIKERDHYTCKLCGNSTQREENLLLEIDHIIPIAKGGLTEESNLQTLCWKCNRSKGAKVM